MDIVQTILLALIQGITEFLPISSSAHLILPSQVLGWPDQGLAFDVADSMTVLNYGEVVFEGTPDEARESTLLQEIYLGTFEDA